MRSAPTCRSKRATSARARKDNWRTNNYNEINIIENGFLDEFKLAMANLQANNAAGGTRAGSFAYFGPGTGTAPLPIFLAYFNGINAASRRRQRAVHVEPVPLDDVSPDARAVQSGSVHRGHRARRHHLGVDGAHQRDQRRAAGQLLPRQPRLDRRRRRGREHQQHDVPLDGARVPAPCVAEGCSTPAATCLDMATSRCYLSKRIDPINVRNGGTVGDITHAFKIAAVYSLPFGRGERWGSDVNGLVDRDDRRLAGGRQRARAERPAARPWQRAARRHGPGLPAEHVQAADQRSGAGVHVPAGDHRRIVQGVQRERARRRAATATSARPAAATSRRRTASIASSGFAAKASAVCSRSCSPVR